MFKQVTRELFASMTLLTQDGVSFADRLRYILNALLSITPVAFVLAGLQSWFETNNQFADFFLITLIINLTIGAWRHFKTGTFSIIQFLLKNAMMAIILSLVYIALEMLHIVVGANIAGEAFGTLIQVMTLLYPISKIVKSAFILSNGRYPPEFLMRKLYSFERNGDLSKFFSIERTEKEEGFDQYKDNLKNQ